MWTSLIAFLEASVYPTPIPTTAYFDQSDIDDIVRIMIELGWTETEANHAG